MKEAGEIWKSVAMKLPGSHEERCEHACRYLCSSTDMLEVSKGRLRSHINTIVHHQ
jgi:hypothetical protein